MVLHYKWNDARISRWTNSLSSIQYINETENRINFKIPKSADDTKLGSKAPQKLNATTVS